MEEIPIYKQKATRRSANNTALIIGIVAAFILLIVVLLLPKQEDTTIPVQQNQQTIQIPTVPEAKIPSGVTVSGMDIGGMTAEKAAKILEKNAPSISQEREMVLSIDGRTYSILPEEINAQWDIQKAIETALSGAVSDIQLELLLDESAIYQKVQRIYDSLGGVYVPSGYQVETTTNGKILLVNEGCTGFLVDVQAEYEKVLDAYASQIFRVTLSAPEETASPDPIDLEQIYAQVSFDAKNPRVDPQTLEIIPGKDGLTFDIDQANQILRQTKPGDAAQIALVTVPPEGTEVDAWFQDTLGYYKTEYDAENENRTQNLILACEKLNGLILQPGEILSYNETLGKRTREAGYLPAPAYSGTELVDEVGGGICQVSSTLYLSSLFAELTVVERKNHGYPANYIPLGLDATVNWGTTDLKLRNDYELPVKILAEVADGFVKIKIMGVEQRDYYVKMEYRVDDHPSYAAAFRCLYDRETGEQISRALDHTSTYLEDVWCYPGFAESATDET